jgi:hypothetical protein
MAEYFRIKGIIMTKLKSFFGQVMRFNTDSIVILNAPPFDSPSKVSLQGPCMLKVEKGPEA